MKKELKIPTLNVSMQKSYKKPDRKSGFFASQQKAPLITVNMLSSVMLFMTDK